MNYKKEIIIPSTTVAGNIKDFKQSYEIYYYPQDQDLPSKIALYINLIDKEGLKKARRSLYFSSHAQLRQLIIDLTKAYFHLLDERTNPMDRIIWRKAILTDFLQEIGKKQLGIWGQNAKFNNTR